MQALQFAATDGADQRGAFDQLIARGRDDARFGSGAHPVPGAAETLKRNGDGARRADLHHQIHGPDIDAEFERCRGDDGAQVAIFQPRFRIQAGRARKTAVMRCDGFRPQAFRQRMRDCVRKAAAC